MLRLDPFHKRRFLLLDQTPSLLGRPPTTMMLYPVVVPATELLTPAKVTVYPFSWRSPATLSATPFALPDIPGS
jgi:hypothetical protein